MAPDKCYDGTIDCCQLVSHVIDAGKSRSPQILHIHVYHLYKLMAQYCAMLFLFCKVMVNVFHGKHVTKALKFAMT